MHLLSLLLGAIALCWPLKICSGEFLICRHMTCIANLQFSLVEYTRNEFHIWMLMFHFM
jgi:hypothetical protein